ncbi:MAG: hypothetical protein MUF66_15920 [Gammaproteobacteria bacterium]|jgi:hypothetical protein|nr:hypothetical protein [Gammaproteobacteria bacterium]
MSLADDPRLRGRRVEVWLGGGYFGTVVLTGRYLVLPDGAWVYEDEDGGMHRADDLRREGSSGRLEA